MAKKTFDPSVRFVTGWRNNPSDPRFREEKSSRNKKLADENRDHKHGEARLVTPGVRDTGARTRIVIDEVEQKPKVVTATDWERVQWKKRKGDHYVIVNLAQLLQTLRRRMCDPFSGFNHLYKAMFDELQDPKFVMFIRFYITAVGVDPEQPAAFIKLKPQGQEMEFVLPKSFLQDRNAGFVSRNFRW